MPPDGRLYRWTIDYRSADPLASISLAGPNETEIITLIRTATGFANGYDGNPPYTFQEYRAPGRSTYFVRAPVAFDICDRPGPVGQTCSADVHIWGNGGRLSVSGNAPVFATFSESLIPEPGTWALLLTGFALVGASMRRRLPVPPERAAD